MKFLLLSKTNEDKSTEIFPPLLLKPTYIQYSMCTCNAESQKISAKGSNCKEDDMALPLWMLLLNGLDGVLLWGEILESLWGQHVLSGKIIELRKAITRKRAIF